MLLGFAHRRPESISTPLTKSTEVFLQPTDHKRGSVRYHAKRNLACFHGVCVAVLVVCVFARSVVQPVVSTVDIIVIFCMSVAALLFTTAA